MESSKIFWLFIYKQFMDIRFNWKSLGILLFASVLAQYLIIYFAYQPFEPLAVYYSPQEPETLHKGCFFDTDVVHSQTFYSPNTTEVNTFITKICGTDKHIKRFSHSEIMVKHIEECKEYCTGVHFHELTRSLKYTVYTNRMKLSTEQRYVTDSLGSSYSQTRDYRDFLKLQHSIDMEFVQQNIASKSNVRVQVDSMPFMLGGYFHNEAGLIFGYAFPICIIALTIITFIVPLVEEKRDGIKEFLAIATPLSYLNGFAFYIIRLVLYMIYADCVLVVAALYNALGIIPVIYVFLLVFLFILSLMSFSYLLSGLFNEVFHAKICSFFLHCVPFAFLQIPSKVGVYLFSFNAFYEAWEVFQIFGNKRASFNFMDLFIHINESRFSICEIYMILIMQSIIYALLYQYFVAVYPGIGGVRKPYFFFLKPKYWNNINTNEYITTNNSSDAIIIQDLQKEFQTRGRRILIADRMNMVIKNKQITVLLGHNGVGKTTTINMIMGLVAKDNGKITVCSERDALSYRHLIGYCPQHSIYMPYMTCKQHLMFFAKLRGLMHREATILANKLLKQLNLSKKAHSHGKDLSGGMKRRLSLGIAMAGETKVVVLDEPSSGLDIESRRELWDVLLDLRKAKAILITTHHMEEAEVLGDTVSILCNGRVLLTGAPLELKRKVGSGYVLKLCTNPRQFNKDECLEFIRADVSAANIMETVPPTILISLPYQHRKDYGKLLNRLEKHQEELGITRISITDTTLEDVFLHSASKIDEIDGAVNCHADITNMHIPYHRLDSANDVSSFQQFKALAYKKFLFIKNEWCLGLIMISAPFLFTTIAILIIHMSTVTTFGKGLDLSLSHYRDGIIFINIPQDPQENVQRISQLLRQQITMNSSLQARNLILNGTNNVEEALIEMMKKDFYTFQQEVIGCIDIYGGNSPTITILFSENMIHSSAILLNLVDNVINMWNDNVNKMIFKTIYAPVATHDASAASLQLAYYALFVPTGMFLLMFYFAMLPFMENRNGFKRLQAVSTTIYWLDILVIDLLLFCGICLMLFGYQALIMPHELYQIPDLINIVFAVFFYGLSYLPLVYTFANLFTALSTLSSCMTALFFMSFIPTIVLSISVGDMIKYSNFILFLRLLPDFNLAHQFRIINERFVNNHEENVPQNVRYELNNKHVLKLANFYYYALTVFSLLMFCFLFVVENKKRRDAIANLLKFSKRATKSEQCPTPDQEDDRLVREEKSVVDKIFKDSTENEYPLFVQNLYKYYTELPAVNGLSFVVRKKECFGLLGVNGAGKTTTFEMIAANLILSSGVIKIDGIDVSRETEYRYRFGYCPQNDCLNDFMTAYQILKYMATLRGIKASHVHLEATFWLEQLDLLKYKNTQVKYYSGGTKRKLQTAAAMIGSPSLVLLDEPTTGVDPASRRFLWKSMQDFQKRDKTIVLTSHSMDECEHLCNRLAIMVDGQFKCLGYVPELKHLHGTGFTISLKLVSSDVSDEDILFITQKLHLQFSKCKLRENHAGILTYFIKADDSIIWSQVFLKSEEFFRASSHLIEEYSVNESTLEDIFLKCDNKRHCNSYANDDNNYGTNGCSTIDSSQIEDV